MFLWWRCVWEVKRRGWGYCKVLWEKGEAHLQCSLRFSASYHARRSGGDGSILFKRGPKRQSSLGCFVFWKWERNRERRRKKLDIRVGGHSVGAAKLWNASVLINNRCLNCCFLFCSVWISLHTDSAVVYVHALCAFFFSKEWRFHMMFLSTPELLWLSLFFPGVMYPDRIFTCQSNRASFVFAHIETTKWYSILCYSLHSNKMKVY